MDRRPVRLSLITPSGELTLGNLLGALRPMALGQATAECYFGIADLHALTTTHHPALARERSLRMATSFLAAGLDRSTLFVQSRVPAHAQLAYLLECVATTGELNRMTQFKEKGRDQPSTRVSLFTYPALMAADILLYSPTEVPVGDDQRQHVELTRGLANRFNRTYGAVFTVPRASSPPAGARVMNLAEPTRKMSKSETPSGPGAAGVIRLLDGPDVVRRVVGRAVTDSETGPSSVRTDRGPKPGVSNLLDILLACGGSGEGLRSYGALKQAVTDAVVATLEPVQRHYDALASDPAHVAQVYADGAARCREVTEPVLAAAQTAMGL